MHLAYAAAAPPFIDFRLTLRSACCSTETSTYKLTTNIQSSVFAQGWHNITVAEELKRAVQIASGFQGTVNTVKGTVNTVEGTSDAVYGTVTTGPPLHPSSPESMLDSSKTAHTSEPACLEQLSMSPAFSLNSSHSQSNSLSKVEIEPEGYFGAETGFSLSFIIIILLSIHWEAII